MQDPTRLSVPGWCGLLLVALFAGCSPPSDHFTLSKPRLPGDGEIAADFVALMNQHSTMTLTLSGGDSADTSALERLAAGESDLAFVSNYERFRPGIQTVMPMYPSVLHIAHRRGVDVSDPGELLRDRSVYAGPPDSSTRSLLEYAADDLGISYRDIDFVSESSCPDVVVVFAPILRDLPRHFSECGVYQLFSLGDPGQIGLGGRVDAITLLNPNLRPFVIPASTYRGLTPEPVLTLAVDKLLVTRADMPDPAIYDLIGEILRIKPVLVAAYPGLFHELSDSFAAGSSAFVLHPGAQAFLRRNEPDIYERYSGVAEVAVTLAVGLVSGFLAVVRIYNIRRKNRIDTFYAEALELRDRGRAGESSAAIRQAIGDLRDLQDRAFGLLVDEKLAPNESFRIFVTLIQDSVSELERAASERAASSA